MSISRRSPEAIRHRRRQVTRTTPASSRPHDAYTPLERRHRCLDIRRKGLELRAEFCQPIAAQVALDQALPEARLELGETPLDRRLIDASAFAAASMLPWRAMPGNA